MCELKKSEKKVKTFSEKYTAIKEIGRGGMGAVYLAMDNNLQRQVAIKELILSPDLEKEEIEQCIYNFKREALAIAKLNHENIVNIYDIGKESDFCHYIVMELLDGKAISEIMQLHPLPPEMVLNVVVQICSALSYIHRNNVIHRDIKPENIIISGKGIAKLTDFGIAKSANEISDHKNSGNIIGTILYMSPEQIQDPDNVDERADLYSFAISVYQLLTGKLPFNGENVREVLMNIMTKEPKSPSELNPLLPKALDSIILKAMAKDKNQRYSSVEEFEKELRNISEYKHFLQATSMSFSNKKTEHEKEITDKKLSESNPKEIIYTPTEINKSSLGWIDQLDFLYREENKTTNEKSVFVESLNCIVPLITLPQLKNLLKTLKSLPDITDILKLLSIFDGSKTLKDIFENELKTKGLVSSLIELGEKHLLPDEVSNTLKGLNLVVKHSVQLQGLLIALRKLSNPSEIIDLLSLIDNEKSIFQIVEAGYSLDKLMFVLSLLYESNIQEIIEIKTLDHNNEIKILIGEMLVAFGFITNAQLNLALKEQISKKKPIGEILFDLNFLSKENLLETLKYQLWYRRFFLNN